MSALLLKVQLTPEKNKSQCQVQKSTSTDHGRLPSRQRFHRCVGPFSTNRDWPLEQPCEAHCAALWDTNKSNAFVPNLQL